MWIDLIYTSQPNLVIESGIHSSFYSSCHHQIVFAKFNLKICQPLPYSRLFAHFKEAKSDLIRRALDHFNWERANTDVNKNVLSNFIPHETILCDNKDPAWVKAKNKVLKKYRKNKTNIQLLNKLNFLEERLNGLKTKSKSNYCERIANKLNNP